MVLLRFLASTPNGTSSNGLRRGARRGAARLSACALIIGTLCPAPLGALAPEAAATTPAAGAAEEVSPDAASLALQEQLGLLRRDSRSLAPHLRLGEIYFRLGNDVSARYHLEEYLRSCPAGDDSLRAAHLEGRVLARLGLRRRATSVFSRLVRRPGAPVGAWHDLAQLLREDGFLAEALSSGMKAAEDSEGDTLFLRSARRLWKDAGRPDEALCLSAGLVGRDRPSGEDYFQYGYLSDWLGLKEQARAAYVEALARVPDHPEGHFNLAQILAAEGRVDEAVLHYQTVLRLRPAYEPTYFQLGALLLSSERAGEAGIVFRRYLMAGRDSLALVHAGEILRALGEQGLTPGPAPSSR